MSYKKWIYKYKYLKAEFNEIEELTFNYTVEFNKLFDFKDKNSTPLSSEDNSLKNFKTKKHPESKNLYKKLSKKLHPDKGGSETSFKELNKLYEEEDLLGMIIKAEESNIDISNLKINKSEEEFKSLCNSLEDKIKNTKSTLAWKWAETPDDQKPILIKFLEQVHGVVLKENM